MWYFGWAWHVWNSPERRRGSLPPFFGSSLTHAYVARKEARNNSITFQNGCAHVLCVCVCVGSWVWCVIKFHFIDLPARLGSFWWRQSRSRSRSLKSITRAHQTPAAFPRFPLFRRFSNCSCSSGSWKCGPNFAEEENWKHYCGPLLLYVFLAKTEILVPKFCNCCCLAAVRGGALNTK